VRLLDGTLVRNGLTLCSAKDEDATAQGALWSARFPLSSGKATLHSIRRPKRRQIWAGCASAEGAPRFVPTLQAFELKEHSVPSLTDGANYCRSFGPKPHTGAWLLHFAPWRF